MAQSPMDTSSTIDTPEESFKGRSRIEELTSSSDDGINEISKGIHEQYINERGSYPKHSRESPLWLQPEIINLFHDDLTTTTSEAQAKTLAECLPLLTGKDTQGLPLNSHGLPSLRREAHKAFLHSSLDRLPAPYVVADASRPWFFYWALAGLSALGEDITSYRNRLIETLRPLQNRTGGFGGGHGHLSHCAASYASTLALALVKGLNMIDRKAMWLWLGNMKQADGGFCMAIDAEEDVRGVYCAMTIITLLNLPLELPPDAPARQQGLTKFTDYMGEWIGKCQTYEGGIGSAPGNEAHGAYAFCALACLSILDAPHKSIPRYLNIDTLLSCLTGVQTPAEGGFAGRTNKLVDACYSHWVGGCWALLEAAVMPKGVTDGLWSREGLIRYLLCCCQQPGKKGGMRDKPSTRPDSYHTCYSLSGLSAAQNHYSYDDTAETIDATGRLQAGFNWSAHISTDAEMKTFGYDEADRVAFMHPVFVISFDAVEDARIKFAQARL